MGILMTLRVTYINADTAVRLHYAKRYLMVYHKEKEKVRCLKI